MEKQTGDEIRQGDKTIRLVVSFFTNDLPQKKMVWQKGFVYAVTNRSRGIRGHPYLPQKSFNNIGEIPKAVYDVLKQCDIVIVEHDKNDKNTRRLQIIEY